MAALAAIPMGVVAAMAAMKKKAAPLAPLDMNVVGGEWAMMAAAGMMCVRVFLLRRKVLK